jgi:copper transport protein
MKRLRALLICVAVFFTPGPAYGHAVLLESQPADGAILSDSPREIMLRFNEPVAPLFLRLVGSDGMAVAQESAARAEGDTVRMALRESLPTGTYIASFRVISIDSHPVAGSLLFLVGKSTRAPLIAPDLPAERNTSIAAGAIRAVFVFLLLLSSGGVLALGMVAGFASGAVERSRRIMTGATWAALLIGILSVGVTGCRLLGEPLTALLDPAPWRTGAGSSLGRSLIIAGAGLIALLVCLPRLDQSTCRAVAAGGALVAIASFGFTGHASTAAPAWLMAPVVAIHALCAAFWLGSLHPLLTALRFEPPGSAHAIFTRFSTIAVAAVALLVAVGVVIAAVQIERVEMLWASTYGRILSAKLGMAVLLLVVAAHNKWWATPFLVTDHASAGRRLRLAIHSEYALFAIILALTGALGQIEPPRAALARKSLAPPVEATHFRSSMEDRGYTITLWVTPTLTGHSAILIEVKTASSQPVEAKEVTLDLSLPAAGIEALRRVASRDVSGQFAMHSDDFVVPGRWRADVHVLIDDFTKRSASFDVLIR